jgi:hypothetical protein
LPVFHSLEESFMDNEVKVALVILLLSKDDITPFKQCYFIPSHSILSFTWVMLLPTIIILA